MSTIKKEKCGALVRQCCFNSFQLSVDPTRVRHIRARSLMRVNASVNCKDDSEALILSRPQTDSSFH